MKDKLIWPTIGALAAGIILLFLEYRTALFRPTEEPKPIATPLSIASELPANTLTVAPSEEDPVLGSGTVVAPPTSAPTAFPATDSASCPAVEGVFARTWPQVQNKIGCANSPVIIGYVVEENFESGKMFWREPIDYAQALVLFGNGTWKIFQHAPFVEGSPEYPCADANIPAQSPPTPKRGFGTMWCDIPQIRSGLGNARDAERGYQGYMQEFETGFMIRTDYGASFIFYSNGLWERR